MRWIMVVSLFISSLLFAEEVKAVSYALDAGRFGDQLINYMKAVRFSQQNQLPLLYKPFSYSEELVLSKVHLPLIQFEYPEAVHQVSYYPEVIEHEFQDDEEFRAIVRGLVKPLKPVAQIAWPEERIPVAIHVRTGGGVDKSHARKRYPLKFPSNQFYWKAIKWIADYFKDQPISIYVFTDDRSPKLVKHMLRVGIDREKIRNDIRIDCRMSRNHWKENVLEDFFRLTQFECLIRGDSNFSKSAAIIGGPKIEISAAEDGQLKVKVRSELEERSKKIRHR